MKPEGLLVPLRTIYCVGRNYAEHAKELGNEVPAFPLVFLKPASAALYSGETVAIPSGCKRFDHEVELVVGLDGDGSRKHAIGIDFTARDWQLEAKKTGEPWTRAKGLKGFAALGPFVDAKPPFAFALAVNGAVRQKGDTRDMVFSVDKVLSYIDETFGLGPGDIVFTGTPAGVSPLSPGDKLEAELGAGLSRLSVSIGR